MPEAASDPMISTDKGYIIGELILMSFCCYVTVLNLLLCPRFLAFVHDGKVKTVMIMPSLSLMLTNSLKSLFPIEY